MFLMRRLRRCPPIMKHFLSHWQDRMTPHGRPPLRSTCKPWLASLADLPTMPAVAPAHLPRAICLRISWLVSLKSVRASQHSANRSERVLLLKFWSLYHPQYGMQLELFIPETPPPTAPANAG